MAAAEKEMASLSPDTVRWDTNHHVENIAAALQSRQGGRSVNTQEYDSVLNGPIVDYSFRQLDTLSGSLVLTPRTGFRPNQYTEDKKLMSCSLRLSHNRLSDLSGLNQLIENLFVEPNRLFWIDLSFNSFSSIDPILILCRNLQILNLHGNQILELFEVDKLASLPHLRSLTLHGNPVELMKGYRSYMVGNIPQLKSLDFSTITKQDRSTAAVMKSFTKQKRIVKRKYDD
ncbi:leucine rich repeat containing 51 [Heptranchias perlo]|uniref:leucine rich repeat containing 51 n=1 Tax=Heptranchias perlo TaxID=212740 RepID=UPI003559B153